MNQPVQNLKGKAAPPANHAEIEGGTEVQLPSFLIGTLNGSKWPASYPNFFTAGLQTPNTLA
jgi:hypothetical protein